MSASKMLAKILGLDGGVPDLSGMTYEHVLGAVKKLDSLDWSGALEALELNDFAGDLRTAASALDIVSGVVPGVMPAEIALMVAAAVVSGYQSGRIRSASVEDPAMERAVGSKAR